MAKRRDFHLTWIGAAGLAWNLIGLLALAGDAFGGDSARYTLSAAQRALEDLTPNWVHLGSAVAVSFGAIGSIGLMLRRNWCVLAFIGSLLGLLAQDIGMGLAIWWAGTLPDALTLALQPLVLAAAVALLVIAFAARDAHRLR